MATPSGPKKRRRRAPREPGGLFAYFDAPEARLADAPAVQWRQTIRRRIIVVVAFLTLWAVGIETRLVNLQVWQHDFLKGRADYQRDRMRDVLGRRGDILDRNGEILATSSQGHTVYVAASEIDKPPEEFAKELCAVELSGCDNISHLIERLRKGVFTYVERKTVSEEEVAAVRALELRGVGFEREPLRQYPNDQLLAHVLGWVGTDNIGIEGVEATYDGIVRGRDGQTLDMVDVRGRVFNWQLERPSMPGITLELTIDKHLQYIAERELRAAVNEHKAEGGTVIILESSTGDVLALANEPTFDLNKKKLAPEKDHRRNRATQDIYEPGSIFKLVSIAAALEQEVVQLDDQFDVSTGSISRDNWGGHKIDDYTRYDGSLSVVDIVVKSSNVGAVQIAEHLRPDTLYEYAKRFGFGQRVSTETSGFIPGEGDDGPEKWTVPTEFPGESVGLLHPPKDWKPVNIASFSIGYYLSATPLQLVTAVNAIANGGVLVRPRLVRATRQNGDRVELLPHSTQRAVTPTTALMLTNIMEEVVKRGTGRNAAIPGYTVAGKTGTARKYIGGAYSATEHRASFIGFVPSRDPVFTILVLVDSPGVATDTGGAVAAPVFRRITEIALRDSSVSPTTEPISRIFAKRRGDSLPVVPTTPLPAPAYASVAAVDSESLRMPDLSGMGLRRATRTLTQLGLFVKVQGDGVVVAQWPSAGSAIERGEEGVLQGTRQMRAVESSKSHP